MEPIELASLLQQTLQALALVVPPYRDADCWCDWSWDVAKVGHQESCMHAKRMMAIGKRHGFLIDETLETRAKNRSNVLVKTGKW